MEHKETAVLCAMNLLTARDYTEKQLRDKLNKREYSSDEIQAAIDEKNARIEAERVAAEEAAKAEQEEIVDEVTN